MKPVLAALALAFCAAQPAAADGPLHVTMSSHGTRVVDNILVPYGYRPAWTDGRVNFDRGPRTVAGDAAMARIWTDGVPRALATAHNPGPPLAPAGALHVEAGRYHALDQAEAAAAALQVRGGGVRIAQGTVTGQYRVLIGPFDSLVEANAALASARAQGLTPAAIR
ncbi:hypothetical protein HKCCE2091_12600 [Rhodobacterales bacterium HKCCE2091]|nr:hypothetical protein [Rhodobacterales bacterium HKCCE2091]